MDTFIKRTKDLKKKLNRPLVGIALGSGSARGLAHIGILQVLAENDIPIDVISGTSIGSLIGAMVLCGWTPEFLGRFAKTIGKRQMLSAIDLVVPPKRGLIGGKRLEGMLARVLKIKNIEELPRPYAAISADITTGERVIHESGDLVGAVRSSISIPGIFEPVPFGKGLLVDGAIVDPVPLDILDKAEVDIKIGVNVLRRPSSAQKPDGIIDILLITTEIMGARIFASRIVNDAIILEPLSQHNLGGLEFDKADLLIDLGRANAKENIPKIREKLQDAGVL